MRRSRRRRTSVAGERIASRSSAPSAQRATLVFPSRTYGTRPGANSRVTSAEVRSWNVEHAPERGGALRERALQLAPDCAERRHVHVDAGHHHPVAGAAEAGEVREAVPLEEREDDAHVLE